MHYRVHRPAILIQPDFYGGGGGEVQVSSPDDLDQIELNVGLF